MRIPYFLAPWEHWSDGMSAEQLDAERKALVSDPEIAREAELGHRDYEAGRCKTYKSAAALIADLENVTASSTEKI